MTARDRLRGARGTSLLELLMVMTVVAIASSIAFASVERSATAARETGAARAFAMRVRQTRLEAVRRSTGVALHFITTSTVPQFRAYADGNGNGVRTRDITSGADPPLGAAAALEDGLGGVRFARAADVPLVGDDADASTSSGSAGAASTAGGVEDDGAGAIRIGAAGLLSFGPTGSGTSGTIYLRGPTRQFAVRIYGPTGRVRLLEFDPRARAWVEK
jgi:prepilin-type N-terminal cleavage/methylation domain-containing protein